MKKLLGSLLLLSMSLFAKSSYEWQVSLSERELYLHQSTVLKMVCTFSKEGKNDDIEFVPPSDGAFEYILLSENRSFEGAIQTLTYQYLLFAKETGTHQIILKPQMLFTTQSAIDNVIIGRDNVNDLEVEKEIAKITPIEVVVKENAYGLAGRLQITSDLDLREVSAYEPVHLAIRIEGDGNLHDLDNIQIKIDGVEVFSDEAQKQYALSETGYIGSWSQRFAFVSQEDFVIPSIEIGYLDLTRQQEKVLKTEAFPIKIKADGIKREELIDKVDLPSEGFTIEKYIDYLYYFLSFISGFIVAKLVKLPQRTAQKQKGEKIKEAKTQKELLETLIVCDKHMFASEIQLLESAVYGGNSVDIKIVKKQAFSKL